MAAEDESNFFSRWSRRKVQVRTGQPLPADPPVVAPAPGSPSAATPSSPAARAVSPASSAAGTAATANPDKAAAPATPAAEAPPPLTLDDVAQLTPDGDFKPFMARQVAPEVRNAAVKKLFSDPHFNIMDGLDIYIDDYSKPSPLSAADMAGMVSAQFLKLVDDPNEVKPAVGVAPDATTTAAPPAPAEAEHHTEPQPEPEAVAEAPPHNLPDPASAEEPPEPHDDHADLQLQPDHAPEPQGPGRGAG